MSRDFRTGPDYYDTAYAAGLSKREIEESDQKFETMNKFDKNDIRTTKTYHDPEQGYFIVEYGTHKLDEQLAYVSVTITGWSRNWQNKTNENSDFGGCCHELVLKYAPELKPLIELHLSSVDGLPMHYIENAKYWWWSSQEKRSSKEYADIFRKHVLCGVLPCDKFMPQPEDMIGWEQSGIEEFLNGRRELLHAYTQQILEKFLSKPKLTATEYDQDSDVDYE